MTALSAPVGDGHTLLPDDARAHLLQADIATQQELYAAEQLNIAAALLRPRPRLPTLLDDSYLRGLHKAMFCEVWAWAGQYRRLETNIGIQPALITEEVRKAVDDAGTWVEHETYEPDELAVRFHHRLVCIHPFVDGNGRHSRISADYLIAILGSSEFSWGRLSGLPIASRREQYLAALHKADSGAMNDLVEFARS